MDDIVLNREQVNKWIGAHDTVEFLIEQSHGQFVYGDKPAEPNDIYAMLFHSVIRTLREQVEVQSNGQEKD